MKRTSLIVLAIVAAVVSINVLGCGSDANGRDVAIVSDDQIVMPDQPNGNPNYSDNVFKAAEVLPVNGFQSVGPVGSGAAHEWPALNDLDGESISYIIVRVFLQTNTSNLATAGSSAGFHAIANGGTAPISGDNLVAYEKGGINIIAESLGHGNMTTVFIPVDPNLIFEAGFTLFNIAKFDCNLILVGGVKAD